MKFDRALLAFQGSSKNRAGNVSMIFAMIAVPLMGALGLALDYGTLVRLKSEMQTTLDVSVLDAVATANSPEELASRARTRLAEEFGRQGLSPVVNVSADPTTGTVSVTADLTQPTMFMGILGHPTSTLHTSSSAVSGAGGAMDLAIAFDTTGSMAGAKLTNAQQAASDLVDLLFKLPGSNSPNPNVRVGLVPFDYHVNVGMGYRNASWISVPADYTSSNTECGTYTPVVSKSNCTTTTTTRTCSSTNDGVTTTWTCTDTQEHCDIVYGSPVYSCNTDTQAHGWNGCVGSQNDPADSLVPASGSNPVPGLLDTHCSSPLVRLINDPAAVKTAIAGLTAQNETYIAPGVLWAWRLLSPDPSGPFVDGGPKGATKKRLIIMTDGANTHSASYPDHKNTDVSAADAKLLEVCNNVKADGVQIYAIAFDVSDPTIIGTLTQCASGPPYFYNASTIADMTGAFQKIGRELTTPRLTK